MHFLIVAACDEALERARQLEALGIALHQVPSVAHARLALLAEPHIDAVLIDATSDLARAEQVAAAGLPVTERSDALAAAIDAARAKGFLVLPAEPGNAGSQARLPGNPLFTSDGPPLAEGGVELDAMEERLIREALVRARGNKSQAARLLGITRRMLYCRMEKHGIEDG